MPLRDEDIEKFRQLQEKHCGVPVSFTVAKIRYLQVLHLYRILVRGHPKAGDGVRTP